LGWAPRPVGAAILHVDTVARHRIVAGFVTLGVPHERAVASGGAEIPEADIGDAASGRINYVILG